MSEGRHRFEVKTRDAAGNESAVVAHEWTIDTTPPRVPAIDSGPGELTTANSALVAFSDDETGVTFSCRLDGGEFSACESPREYATVEDGEHAFEVRALDAAANASAPARHRWTVLPDELTLGDGAWSWFADPRAVHDPLRGKTYVGWVARDGDVDHDHPRDRRQRAPDRRLRAVGPQRLGPAGGGVRRERLAGSRGADRRAALGLRGWSDGYRHHGSPHLHDSRALLPDAYRRRRRGRVERGDR